MIQSSDLPYWVRGPVPFCLRPTDVDENPSVTPRISAEILGEDEVDPFRFQELAGTQQGEEPQASAGSHPRPALHQRYRGERLEQDFW